MDQQASMLVQQHWERIALEADAVRQGAEFWARLVDPFGLNENGTHQLMKLVKLFTISEIVDAMATAAHQYVVIDGDKPTADSVEFAWNHVGRILHVRKADKSKPYLRDLLYVRKIVKNRLQYCNERVAFELLEQAFEAGVALEEMKRLAQKAYSWTHWQHEMCDLIAS